MAWRCRFLAARPSQVGRVIAEKWLSEELSGAPDTLVDFHTGHARIAETLKGWAHRELADVMDDGPAAQRARHEEARALLRRSKRRDDSLAAVCGGGWAC